MVVTEMSATSLSKRTLSDLRVLARMSVLGAYRYTTNPQVWSDARVKPWPRVTVDRIIAAGWVVGVPSTTHHISGYTSYELSALGRELVEMHAADVLAEEMTRKAVREAHPVSMHRYSRGSSAVRGGGHFYGYSLSCRCGHKERVNDTKAVADECVADHHQDEFEKAIAAATA